MRYWYGIDVHSEHLVVCRIDSHKNSEYLNFENTEKGREELRTELSAHGPCAVGMEACTGSWALHAEIVQLVERAEIIDPQLFRERFPKKGKKTDVRDAHNLAQYVQEEHGGIWVPDEATRHRRQLCQLRESIVKILNQTKNAVHATLKEHHINHRRSVASLWTQQGRRWLSERGVTQVTEVARVALSHNLRVVDLMEGQRRDVEAMMAAECERTPEMLLLSTHPGIGSVAAYVMVAEIGDIKRFETAKKLVSYAGLAPGVSQTGGPGAKARTFGITKRGRSRLRWIVVECGLAAVRSCDRLRNLYTRLVRRTKISGKAQVAVGRKLLVHAWHMLQKGAQFDKLDPRKQAVKVAARRKLAESCTLPVAKVAISADNASEQRQSLTAPEVTPATSVPKAPAKRVASNRPKTASGRNPAAVPVRGRGA